MVAAILSSQYQATRLALHKRHMTIHFEMMLHHSLQDLSFATPGTFNKVTLLSALLLVP